MRYKCITTLILVSGLGASAAWADKCGPSDRVNPPECVSYGWEQLDPDKQRYDYYIRNNCWGPVTIKLDLKYTWDERKDINAGAFWKWKGDKQSKKSGPNKVKCCPNYNKCDY